MGSNQLNRGLILNTLWSLLGRFGYTIIALISNIILVRLLSPTEFGQVSIIMFFIIISNIMIESGLSGALVRKKTANEIDYSTVFIFNLVISLLLMMSLMLTSSYIADFYNDRELSSLIWLASLVLVSNALRITQNVKLIRDLKFKTKSIYEIIAVTIGSIVAIFVAMHGAGATSLVSLQLTTSITLTILMWMFVGPVKSFSFSIDSFKQVYKFGINTTISSLLNKAFDNSYQLILAKYFSISQSGYFYQAKKLQEVPIGVLQDSVFGVVYATLSKLQDNTKHFNQLYFSVVRVFTIVVALICILIYFYADLVVNILYGPEWITSASYLKILMMASFFYLQEVFNRILFKIFDRTDLILKLEIVKKFILTFTIIYGIKTLSIYNLLYGFVVVSAISFLINYHFARSVHEFSYWSELNIILKTIVISVITVTISLYIQSVLGIQGFNTLFVLPIILLVYLLLLIIFRVISLKNDYRNLQKIMSK